MPANEPLDITGAQSPESDDLSAGSRTTQIAAGLAILAVVVMLVVGIGSAGSDDASPTPTTGSPQTSVAPTTTLAPTTTVATTLPPTTLASTVEVQASGPITAIVLALDVDRNLVEINMDTGEITRHELIFDPGFLLDIVPFGANILFVGLNGSQIVLPDRRSGGTVIGVPVVWDNTTIWSRFGLPPRDKEFIVREAGKNPVVVAAPNFEFDDAFIDGGDMVIRSPTGVIRLAADGTVSTDADLTHLRRGPVRVITRCEGATCRPLIVHDDGTEFEVPDGTDVDTITLAWSGQFAAGGDDPANGWVLNVAAGQLGNVVLPSGTVSWVVGADIMVIARDARIVLFDPAGLPGELAGRTWSIDLPGDTRPTPFLVIAEPAS